MSNRRRHERIEASLEIKVTWSDTGTKETTTINFSDGGALVKNVFGTVPPVGATITLQLLGTVLGKEAPLLVATVVRGTEVEIACQFVEDEQCEELVP